MGNKNKRADRHHHGSNSKNHKNNKSSSHGKNGRHQRHHDSKHYIDRHHREKSYTTDYTDDDDTSLAATSIAGEDSDGETNNKGKKEQPQLEVIPEGEEEDDHKTVQKIRHPNRKNIQAKTHSLSYNSEQVNNNGIKSKSIN